MLRKRSLCLLTLFALFVFNLGLAQHPADDAGRAPAHITSPLPRIAIGIKMSSLGPGIEVGTALTQRTNLRFGFNAINYSRRFDQDGFQYNGDLTLRSLEAHWDWFVFGGAFHISPGLLVFLGDPARGSTFVPAEQTFTVNDVEYRSDRTDPITGNGTFRINHVAPTFTVGWGNLLPRGSKHFTFPVELGFAVMGAPNVTISLRGSACDAKGRGCENVTRDPDFQRNLNTQQRSINDDLSPYKVYPLISAGVAYRF